MLFEILTAFLVSYCLSLLQSAEIEECRIHGSLQFITLKKLNRLSHLRCKKVRDATNEVTIDDIR